MSIQVLDATTGLIERHPDKVNQLFKKHHIKAYPNHRNMWLALRARKRPFFDDLMSVLGGLGSTLMNSSNGMRTPGASLSSSSPTASSIAAINPSAGGYQVTGDVTDLLSMGSFTGEISNATGQNKAEKVYQQLVDGLGRYVQTRNNYTYQEYGNRYFRPWERPWYRPNYYPVALPLYNSNGDMYSPDYYNQDNASASASAGVSATGSVDLGAGKQWIYILLAGLVLLYLFNRK